jgi:ABC-type uncharacterized transport system ATPase component
LLAQDPIESIATSLTVRGNLALAVGRRDDRRSVAAVPRVSDEIARELLSRVTEGAPLISALDRPAASLSGGQIQLLAVGAATLDGSRIILADEPVKMLDPNHKQLVERELVRLASDRLVIMSSHEPRPDLTAEENHYCLRDGTLFEGIT